MAVIPTIADILLSQFQAESAVRWQSAYGAFCSQHSDSVAIYKDLLKSDRRKGPSSSFFQWRHVPQLIECKNTECEV
jgi:hypothetical protein